ncbi:OmpA family protein [Pseudomonas sp. 10B1]|uniref:OmpA family protein n=1 Tax=unclassified Pseudomonas TaxID=196821 RepID=UPI002AB34DC2|nr:MULTISPECIES: OmpA family protein [unclassified Pseudomonas]MDY7559560.1 OmpA family protein [Pseudomonas sp. AB6]MEA9977531.1 OmpA family protein [Pseudomonas sp. RTS4]MEA9996414.1 OmpA family protein [Pseudomonas sp. AA4]MEB0088083.1 OmpA family protein [Pseudomonas sp. RTI1]MEB0126910.1 OmpA family protein [Pseudomonas sp. CCC1.2]
MRTSLMLPVAAVASLLLAGCAVTPENADLLQARSQFSALQAKPQSSTLAALETKDAFMALGKADKLSSQNRKAPAIEQLAYVASQKIALAEQTILGREAEAGLKRIDAERTQVRLDVRTAQLRALQAMKAKTTERGQVITFGDVLFDTGKAELKYGSQRNFQQLAEFLRANPERKVRIEGFTDSTGGNDYNQQLSERRAFAVVRALAKLGVGTERMTGIGYGAEHPIADNASEHSRQLNRRVEVIVSNDATVVETRL